MLIIIKIIIKMIIKIFNIFFILLKLILFNIIRFRVFVINSVIKCINNLTPFLLNSLYLIIDIKNFIILEYFFKRVLINL